MISVLSHKAHRNRSADIPKNADADYGKIIYAKKSIENKASCDDPKITGTFRKLAHMN